MSYVQGLTTAVGAVFLIITTVSIYLMLTGNSGGATPPSGSEPSAYE